MSKLTPEERAKRKLKREEQKKAKQEKVGRLNERKLKRLLIIFTFLNENPQRWVKTLKKDWSFRTRDVTEWIELLVNQYIKSDGKTWTGKLRNKKRFPKIVQDKKNHFSIFKDIILINSSSVLMILKMSLSLTDF